MSSIDILYVEIRTFWTKMIRLCVDSCENLTKVKPSDNAHPLTHTRTHAHRFIHRRRCVCI